MRGNPRFVVDGKERLEAALAAPPEEARETDRPNPAPRSLRPAVDRVGAGGAVPPAVLRLLPGSWRRAVDHRLFARTPGRPADRRADPTAGNP